MKHISVILLAALLALGATSCKKKELENMGTFAEGIYQPDFHISAVNQGSTPVQIWSWGTTKLSSISLPQEGASYAFSYTGDQLGSVTITQPGQQTQRINYSYGGSLLTKVEIVNGNRTDITMTVNHDANDHIATANLDFSDKFLIDIAYGMLTATKTLSRLVGDENAKAIATVAKSMSKYSITNKTFSLTYTWSGDNITRSVLTGNVSAKATLSDLSEVLDLGALGNILNYIDQGTEMPISCTVNRTTTSSFDEMNNPLYCLYADGISEQNLSKNNLLSSVATGSADLTIKITVPDNVPILGGQQYPQTRTLDLSSNASFTYTYNKKNNLPETYTTNGQTYTYVY